MTSFYVFLFVFNVISTTISILVILYKFTSFFSYFLGVLRFAGRCYRGIKYTFEVVLGNRDENRDRNFFRNFMSEKLQAIKRWFGGPEAQGYNDIESGNSDIESHITRDVEHYESDDNQIKSPNSPDIDLSKGVRRNSFYSNFFKGNASGSRNEGLYELKSLDNYGYSSDSNEDSIILETPLL